LLRRIVVVKDLTNCGTYLRSKDEVLRWRESEIKHLREVAISSILRAFIPL
jgi:hypothetical protein